MFFLSKRKRVATILSLLSLRRSYWVVASNTIYQVLGRFISAAVAMIITRWLTRALGIEGYGSYQLIIAYASFYWILTDFGLNAVAVKEMAAHSEQKELLWQQLLTLRFLLGLLLTLFLIILSFFLPYPPLIREGIIIVALTILAQGIRGACSGMFQLQLRYDLQLLAEGSGSLLFLVLVWLLLRQGAGLRAIVIAFLGQYLWVTLLNLLFVRRWSSWRFNFDRQGLKKMIQAALPLGLALLFNLFANKLDTFLLSLRPQPHPPLEAVGYYGLGLKFFEFLLVLPVFFMNVLYPRLAKNFQQGWLIFRQTIFKGFLVLLALSISGGGFLFFTSPLLLKLVTQGVEIGPAVKVLRLLSLEAPLFFLSALLMWVLVILDHQRTLIFVYAVSFLFSFLANWFLIPHWSYLAPALVKGGSEALILLQLAFFSWYYSRNNDEKSRT